MDQDTNMTPEGEILTDEQKKALAESAEGEIAEEAAPEADEAPAEEAPLA